MLSFLEQTVQHLYKKYGDDIADLCIVLPNRRAGLFLKKYLAKNLNKTFWSPEIYATEDFVQLLSGKQNAEPLTLLFELYETVKECNPSNSESFDDFCKWGQILLGDFNEIDRYLVDADQLFGNLKNIKELESWTLNKEDELTEFQKRYLDFWNMLGSYYKSFSAKLLLKNETYQGLAYRIVATDIDQKIKNHSWRKIIFCGFNALNLAEEKIIEKLIEIGKAEIIWDVDAYYSDDIQQEAGRFFRRYSNSQKFSKFKEHNIVLKENLLSTELKNITLVGAAKNVAQAKVAGNVLSDLLLREKSLQNTALVLADEKLLFPVLHSLPEDLEDVNVTMGYPLRNTSVAGFFDLLFNLHENGSRISGRAEKYSFYHTDLLRLLDHAYTSVLLNDRKGRPVGKSVNEKIKARNIIFSNYKTLERLFNEEKQNSFQSLSVLFKTWRSPADVVQCLSDLIDQLRNNIVSEQETFGGGKSDLELEYLFAFTKIINRIQVLIKDFPDSIIDVKCLRNVMNQIARSATLPFYGEPLMGLQVMGMLETRTLDFENVVLISCNEDILPSGKSQNTFVPYELKRHFGLPTYSDKDAIFAYHFYRLIQRAKNIYLIYNTESDEYGSGEKSRFLTQLLYELPRKNKQAVIQDLLLNIPSLPISAMGMLPLFKDEWIFKKLNEKAVKGFSPSLLNQYRNCKMQFYFNGIAGLREADEVDETIGADVLGTTIHAVLEKLYQPFIGRKLQINDLKEMKREAERLVEEEFLKNYDETETRYGKNFLTTRVAVKFIMNFLNSEITYLTKLEKEGRPMIIEALEAELNTIITLGDREIRIHGKADRIDSVGSVTRIIDYKTGKVEDAELKIDSWEDKNSDKSFQLLMYGLMYQKMNPRVAKEFQSGIIALKKQSAAMKPVSLNSKNILDKDFLDGFENQLSSLLQEIFDPENPFVQTEDLKVCEYCNYKGICNRSVNT